MATPAQINANRQNAQQSTGPRTEEGKVRASLNAVKHGLNSKRFFVREDEQEEFAALRDALTVEFVPRTMYQWDLFQQVLHASWKMYRVDRCEAELLTAHVDPFGDESCSRQLEMMARHRARAERAYYRAVKELRAHTTNLLLVKETLPVPFRKGASQLLDAHQIHRSIDIHNRAWRDSDPDIWNDPDNPDPPPPPVRLPEFKMW